MPSERGEDGGLETSRLMTSPQGLARADSDEVAVKSQSLGVKTNITQVPFEDPSMNQYALKGMIHLKFEQTTAYELVSWTTCPILKRSALCPYSSRLIEGTLLS